jgi:hypothetical protein
MTCPNCTSLKADYITLSARFDRVLAERDKWHAEYDNLAKFATQYERERDVARGDRDDLCELLKAAEARAEECDKLQRRLGIRDEAYDDLLDAQIHEIKQRQAAEARADLERRAGEIAVRSRDDEADKRRAAEAERDRLAEALRALWDEDAFGPHPALIDTPEPKPAPHEKRNSLAKALQEVRAELRGRFVVCQSDTNQIVCTLCGGLGQLAQHRTDCVIARIDAVLTDTHEPATCEKCNRLAEALREARSILDEMLPDATMLANKAESMDWGDVSDRGCDLVFNIERCHKALADTPEPEQKL